MWKNICKLCKICSICRFDKAANAGVRNAYGNVFFPKTLSDNTCIWIVPWQYAFSNLILASSICYFSWHILICLIRLWLFTPPLPPGMYQQRERNWKKGKKKRHLNLPKTKTSKEAGKEAGARGWRGDRVDGVPGKEKATRKGTWTSPTPRNKPRPTFKTKEAGKEKEIETKGNKFETFLHTLLAAQV